MKTTACQSYECERCVSCDCECHRPLLAQERCATCNLLFADDDDLIDRGDGQLIHAEPCAAALTLEQYRALGRGK